MLSTNTSASILQPLESKWLKQIIQLLFVALISVHNIYMKVSITNMSIAYSNTIILTSISDDIKETSPLTDVKTEVINEEISHMLGSNSH